MKLNNLPRGLFESVLCPCGEIKLPFILKSFFYSNTTKLCKVKIKKWFNAYTKRQFKEKFGLLFVCCESDSDKDPQKRFKLHWFLFYFVCKVEKFLSLFSLCLAILLSYWLWLLLYWPHQKLCLLYGGDAAWVVVGALTALN